MARTTKSESLAQRLRRLREGVPYTRRELAEYSGVPERTIVNLEHSDRDPGLSVAGRLAQALGVSLDELAGLDSRGSP